jgi:hypothetical protein
MLSVINMEQVKTPEQIYKEALEFIASKSWCECWEPPGMGSYLPYVWRGCGPHKSDDEEEWCLCCTAKAALELAKNSSVPP